MAEDEPSRGQGSSWCSLTTLPQHLQAVLAGTDTAAVFFLASCRSDRLLLGLWALRQLAQVRESCARVEKSDQQAEIKLRSKEKRRKAKHIENLQTRTLPRVWVTDTNPSFLANNP